MLPDIRDFDRLTRDFRWRIPHRYNIGVDVCDRWAAADPARVAVIEAGLDGSAATFTKEEFIQNSKELCGPNYGVLWK
jgi:acetyl-CoA synthetase